MTFLGKSRSFIAVSSKSYATSASNSFCSCGKCRGTNFATTRFLPRSSVKISETIVHGIPSASSHSRTVIRRFSLIAARTLLTLSDILLVEGLPERGSVFMDSHPCRYHNFMRASLIESSTKAFLIIRIVSPVQV